MADPNTETATVGVGGGTPQYLGNAATDLVGFYGTAPVSQAATFAAVTTTTAVAVSGAYGFNTAAQADAVVTGINSIRTALRAIGIVA